MFDYNYNTTVFDISLPSFKSSEATIYDKTSKVNNCSLSTLCGNKYYLASPSSFNQAWDWHIDGDGQL